MMQGGRLRGPSALLVAACYASSSWKLSETHSSATLFVVMLIESSA